MPVCFSQLKLKLKVIEKKIELGEESTYPQCRARELRVERRERKKANKAPRPVRTMKKTKQKYKARHLKFSQKRRKVSMGQSAHIYLALIFLPPHNLFPTYFAIIFSRFSLFMTTW